MTPEEKQLLLKDLCARLPYGVEIICEVSPRSLTLSVYMLCEIIKDGNKLQWKPYLRPLSSMTEEEINEFILISDTVLCLGDKRSTCILSLEQMDWFNKKMFDYRGLIPMGLALEAPEGMYKTE